MNFDEAVNKYLDEHGDFGTAMHFGKAMYEAGKAAKRRPIAKIGGGLSGTWAVFDSSSGSVLRGGFFDSKDACQWARSNGFEVC